MTHDRTEKLIGSIKKYPPWFFFCSFLKNKIKKYSSHVDEKGKGT